MATLSTGKNPPNRVFYEFVLRSLSPKRGSKERLTKAVKRNLKGTFPMNSETRDYVGWIISLAAALCAIYGAMKSADASSMLFALAVVLLVILERRPAKIVTAALIRIADERGSIRGLVGYNGTGIQIGVGGAPLYNGACSYYTLWQNTPHVAFTFKCSEAFAGEKLYERCPSVELYGLMPGGWRSYSLNFSYKEAAPALSVSEHIEDGVLHRSIPLS